MDPVRDRIVDRAAGAERRVQWEGRFRTRSTAPEPTVATVQRFPLDVPDSIA